MTAPGTSRVERYLGHLDRVSGGVEPGFARFPAPSGPPVSVISYPDLPEPGMLVALTYGLSLGHHEDWVAATPELCVAVRSQDPRWGWAVGDVAAQHRDGWGFHYGMTVDLGERVSPGSAMTGFVLFAPAVLDRADYLHVDVGDRLPVTITGAYPVHEVERQFVGEHGLAAFWAIERDLYDVTRPPVV